MKRSVVGALLLGMGLATWAGLPGFGQERESMKDERNAAIAEMRAMIGHWVAEGTDEKIGAYHAELTCDWIYKDAWVRHDYWIQVDGEVKTKAFSVQGWDAGAGKGVMENYLGDGRIITARECEYKDALAVYDFELSGKESWKFREHFVHPDKDSLLVEIYHPDDNGAYQLKTTLKYKRAEEKE